MQDHFTDIGHSKIDLSRAKRQGLDEVIFGVSKTAEQISEILHVFEKKLGRGMATGVSAKKAKRIQKAHPKACWSPSSKILTLGKAVEKKQHDNNNTVHLVSGGTSDAPIVAEAAETLEFFGYHHQIFVDVGIAGLHRLLSQIEEIKKCRVIIACAGMEAALPSVLAGLVDVPIIGVPTSVGSGVSKGGQVALNSMLSSCAPGIAVTNIDNGFGAAMFAAKMINQFNK